MVVGHQYRRRCAIQDENLQPILNVLEVLDAPTDVARINLLPNEAFKFDFVNHPTRKTVSAAGFGSSANTITMPATVGNNASVSTLNFHTHPCPADTPISRFTAAGFIDPRCMNIPNPPEVSSSGNCAQTKVHLQAYIPVRVANL